MGSGICSTIFVLGGLDGVVFATDIVNFVFYIPRLGEFSIKNFSKLEVQI